MQIAKIFRCLSILIMLLVAGQVCSARPTQQDCVSAQDLAALDSNFWGKYPSAEQFAAKKRCGVKR
jgi:hypothetical protein